VQASVNELNSWDTSRDLREEPGFSRKGNYWPRGGQTRRPSGGTERGDQKPALRKGPQKLCSSKFTKLCHTQKKREEWLGDSREGKEKKLKHHELLGCFLSLRRPE